MGAKSNFLDQVSREGDVTGAKSNQWVSRVAPDLAAPLSPAERNPQQERRPLPERRHRFIITFLQPNGITVKEGQI